MNTLPKKFENTIAGLQAGELYPHCPRCGGSRMISVYIDAGSPFRPSVLEYVNCPLCHATGEADADEARSFITEWAERHEITIPCLRDQSSPTDRATLAGEGCETPPAAASSASTLSASVPAGTRPFHLLAARGSDESAAPLTDPRLDTPPDAATGVELHCSALLFDPCLSAQMAMGIS